MIKLKCPLCGRKLPDGFAYGYDITFYSPKSRIEGNEVLCQECAERLAIFFEEFQNVLNEEEGKILEGRTEDVDEAK